MWAYVLNIAPLYESVCVCVYEKVSEGVLNMTHFIWAGQPST